MQREIRRSDPDIGYTWLESESEYYVRNREGDLRRVSDDAFRLLSELADGTIVVDDLPENARDIVDVLEDEGYLREGDPVVELVPPDDVVLWSRVLAFVGLFGVAVILASQELPALLAVDELFTPGRTLGFAALMLISLVVHESGHYLAANRFLDPTVRVGTVNGIIPAAITDTTGAWMLPRNRRLWITLAGPFAHLLWTHVLLVGYYVLFPDSVLLSLVAVVNVASVVMVLNPLIHGDGYWLLLDAFGIVDLRTRGIDDLRERELSAAAGYVLLSYGFAVGIVVLTAVQLVALLGLVSFA